MEAQRWKLNKASLKGLGSLPGPASAGIRQERSPRRQAGVIYRAIKKQPLISLLFHNYCSASIRTSAPRCDLDLIVTSVLYFCITAIINARGAKKTCS